jgi:hypothetical protein
VESGLPVIRPPPRSWTTTSRSEEVHELTIVKETRAYNALVGDGGRPWYSFDLLDGMSRGYEEHRDTLRALGLKNGCDVYEKQLWRWKKFRRWQTDNRGVLYIEADLKKELAERVVRDKSLGCRPIHIDPEWELKWVTDERTREHRHCVELGVAKMQGKHRFPVYVQAAQTRLKRHGFTR